MEVQRRFKMKWFAVLFTILFAVVSFAAQNEIPLTTSSKEALQHFEKGLHFLDVGRGLEAHGEFVKAIEADTAFSHAYFYLSLAALSPEEFKESLDKGLKNIQGKSEGEKMLLQIGETFIDNNATKRIELSKVLTTKYPNAPRAWMRLGFSEGTVNHHVDARTAFSKALELSPKLVGAHYALGFSYLFNDPKDFNQAQKHLEHCIQLEPNEAKGYEGLGDVLRAKNELEKARNAYTQALEKDPSLSVASLKKGHINSFLGHFDEARNDYDKGIAGTEDVNKVGFANFKALTYVHAGQPKVAIDELQKLVASQNSTLPKEQSDAIDLGTLTNEITIALHHNLVNDAARILDQMKDLTNQTNARVGDQNFARTQNANLLLFEGQLAARKKDYATARSKAEENRKMVEQDNNPRKFEGYYGLLGLTELLQGNHAKAIENYKKADLTNIYVKYQLALAQEGAGNKQEAKSIFREISHWNFNTVGFALIRKDALQRAS
jgi:tetratricopeptide (TPR) repeat protein